MNLRELYVGKNKITQLQGLEKLVKLELLSIQVSFDPILGAPNDDSRVSGEPNREN